jgi:hypothetical protein
MKMPAEYDDRAGGVAREPSEVLAVLEVPGMREAMLGQDPLAREQWKVRDDQRDRSGTGFQLEWRCRAMARRGPVRG